MRREVRAEAAAPRRPRARPAQWLALALALAACKAKVDAPAPDDEAGARTVAVRCAPVATRPTRDEVTLGGTLAPLPERDARVAAQVPGVLKSVAVREGDLVTAGQTLAELDERALDEALRSAQASLGGASAERRNAQAGLARSRRVFEAGIAPRQEVDDAEAHLASARAAEELARAALEQAQRQRGFATVASPLGGVVLKVFAKAGELVDGTAATPIVEVADLGALELVADAPARDLARLAAGQAASVTFDGLPSPLGATVARVAPAIDRASGFGSVHLLLAPAAARPPVGAYGRAAVAVGDARAGLFVPAVAVTSPSDGRGRVMLCGADHRARAVVVALGPTRAGETEVTGELHAGDAVVVEPALGVADGDRLELEAGDAPASGPDPSDPADAAP